MSKLSKALKALISSPIARPGPIPAPRNIWLLYERISAEASAKSVGQPAWLALTTAAVMSMNSPESMISLYQHATKSQDAQDHVKTAELMREVGLKCIGFNGIPRTINMLGAFRASLPPSVQEQLTTTPSRTITPANLEQTQARGRHLWDSIYRPFETKLLQKLAESHPDLPVHIISSHYAALFSDPDQRPANVRVGRVLTSLVAVACLRAQTGVGPQVTSHVFGLRKAGEDGSWKSDGSVSQDGFQWLAGEEGNKWILDTVDRIVETVSQGQGSSFAPLASSIRSRL